MSCSAQRNDSKIRRNEIQAGRNKIKAGRNKIQIRRNKIQIDFLTTNRGFSIGYDLIATPPATPLLELGAFRPDGDRASFQA